jgi:hypothetical protein
MLWRGHEVGGILRALLPDRAAAPYQPTPAAISDRVRHAEAGGSRGLEHPPAVS